MSIPRFILAKYVPDLSRMEPRNIGVFVWLRGEIRSRFLEIADASFVNEPKTYDRWVRFWADAIGKPQIRPYRGKPVDKADPACMDALLTSQEGNYILVDAGELLESPKKKDIGKVVDSLFKELVALPKQEKQDASNTLKSRCDTIMETTGLKDRPDYVPHFPLALGLYGQKHPVHFNYGFGSADKAMSLFQRVNLTKELSVNNAAMTLREATNQAMVDEDSCAALIQTSTINSKAAELAHKWLSNICPVIDVDGQSAADAVMKIVQKASAARLSSRSTLRTEAADQQPGA